MNPLEFQAKVDAARQEYELASSALVGRIERLRLSVTKSEQRLGALKQTLAKRLEVLSREYAGLDVATNPASLPPERTTPTVSGVTAPHGASENGNGNGTRQQIKRRSLDAPLFALATELADPTVTVPRVTAEWKRRNPGLKASRSTVRGALERYAQKGALVIVDEGGRGSAKPRVYGLPT